MLSALKLEELFNSVNMITLSLIGFALVHCAITLALKRREKPETLCNIAIYFGFFFVKHFLTVGITFGSLSFAYEYKLFEIPFTVTNILICIVLADFLYYWKHRLEHQSRILWAAHSVHHSSPEFNLSTALRLPWLTPFYSWIAYVPAAFLGFHPFIVLMASTIVLGYQFLIHTQVVGNLGVLEYILNTPSNHRVHHGSNTPYLDRNYGGIFMIWDILFGTFIREGIPVVYGVTKPINTSNPFRVNSIEVEHLVRDSAKAKGLKDALKIIFKGPGA